MESYLLDWANLLLRWVHVITAIAWVGSSFYFVFLDSSLTPPVDEDLQRQGVSGELWAVHGGGFYHPVKFAVKPPTLPAHLHWFYWESYSTWLTGFALFTVSYLWNAGTYLVDKSLMDWSPGAAIGVALSFFVVFWMLYDGICQLFGKRKNGDAIVGALVLVLVCVASWLACHWFAGRAAFLLVGAMIATAMSANVFFWIIPGQRKVVASIKAGEPVDPVHGQRGKQRSVHNTYFTLPVLFAMLSNHYSFTWGHPQNWLVLILMMLAGALIRQFFVMRHGYKLGRNGNPLPYALVGLVLILGAIVWMKPPPQAAGAGLATDSIAGGAGMAGAAGQNDYINLQKVLEQRCYLCHGAQVQMKNVRLDSPALLRQHAQAVYQQVVVSKTMPMNNSTGITEAERALVRQWFEAGAPVP
ncbi:MAG: urate hydroxylase PuuD [Polaromonas sp.]|uniref:urate hydroxylase PuuD n=1 Tax=Polaromonas sp. TaxID=1869339 RepID=UPI00272FCA68|nr:urate hydroxylase PuuD [Polaromonas sp.]MDP2447993.1 urate hydroxylase PuuD [Polaromonas sp.]MDP3247634.1 urate hydroxylase PuuD [Polaromonas sp.]MDP3757862.1 urate hydroxylase PuuD [Polaromonas sp.]